MNSRRGKAARDQAVAVRTGSSRFGCADQKAGRCGAKNANCLDRRRVCRRPRARICREACKARRSRHIGDEPANDRALAGPENRSDGLKIRVLRASASGASQGIVRALDAKGLAIGETRFEFPKAALETKASFDLPVDLRNDIARMEILDERSAGAVSLLDARWKRRTVAIVSDETADVSLPLLAPNYYLHKALAPFADVREASPGTPDPIGVLLDQHPAVMILPMSARSPTRIMRG